MRRAGSGRTLLPARVRVRTPAPFLLMEGRTRRFLAIHIPLEIDPMPRSFRLYVVALAPSVRQERLFRKENPHGGDRCIYVGSTAHSAEHRFAQHKAGKFCTRRWVQKYGLGLIPDLAGSAEYATREAAEKAEHELAVRLRRQGYAVWSR